MDIIDSLQGFVSENLSLLTPVDQIWQPTDYLPDLTAEDWVDQLTRFREPARLLPDDLLVVLVGNMITEEAACRTTPSRSSTLSGIRPVQLRPPGPNGSAVGPPRRTGTAIS